MTRLNQLSSREIKSRREAVRQQRIAADKKALQLKQEREANKKLEAEAYAKVNNISIERAKLVLAGLIKAK